MNSSNTTFPNLLIIDQRPPPQNPKHYGAKSLPNINRFGPKEFRVRIEMTFFTSSFSLFPSASVMIPEEVLQKYSPARPVDFNSFSILAESPSFNLALAK